ncbi:hypothetical protein EWM64_g3301 [Hericium alpestre]|uniref:FAD-binding domain-containing protein n=1 Tax=Hericium alpestre TaxID=135208 RepID=A0A4Z0A2N7_9AGAM|nr:hypothetical protein EWM64_g3301 [Hericium alpestre]
MSSPKHAVAAPAPKFRVAIWYVLVYSVYRTELAKSVLTSGAEPGGLALARIILKYTPPSDSIAIDIYEAAPEIGAVGAGVGIWPRTSAVLNALGLLDRLSGEVSSMGTGLSEGWGFTFRVSEQAEEGMNFYVLGAPRISLFSSSAVVQAEMSTMRPSASSPDPVMIHRSALLKTLQDGLLLSDASKCTVEIHTNTRLTSYKSPSPTSSITLHFTDRPSAQADVLVDADGIRFTVRNTMFSVLSVGDISLKEKVEPRWAGVVGIEV